MRHFKLPIIVTAIALVLAFGSVLLIGTTIHRAKASNRQKMERAQKLGLGIGVITLLVIAPFWLVAAGKVGKERRQVREVKRNDPSQGE